MNESFQTYKLKPHWIQYAIDQLPWIIIWVTVTLYAGDDTLPYREYLMCGSVCMMCYLIWQAIELWRIEYVITGEQLIYKHGVLFHSADYMELYRIVDYQESRTPVQQLTGLKNILLLSGDRTLPRLRMVGIRGSSRILDEIRIRVEYNKKRRGIYEITNRN
jgi:uncharacterized membrane protein YdbT with pleckstrin-like domain